MSDHLAPDSEVTLDVPYYLRNELFARGGATAEACSASPDSRFTERVLGPDKDYYTPGEDYFNHTTSVGVFRSVVQTPTARDAAKAKCVETGGWLGTTRNVVRTNQALEPFLGVAVRRANFSASASAWVDLQDLNRLVRPLLTDFVASGCSTYGCRQIRAFGDGYSSFYSSLFEGLRYTTAWHASLKTWEALGTAIGAETNIVSRPIDRLVKSNHARCAVTVYSEPCAVVQENTESVTIHEKYFFYTTETPAHHARFGVDLLTTQYWDDGVSMSFWVQDARPVQCAVVDNSVARGNVQNCRIVFCPFSQRCTESSASRTVIDVVDRNQYSYYSGVSAPTTVYNQPMVVSLTHNGATGAGLFLPGHLGLYPLVDYTETLVSSSAPLLAEVNDFEASLPPGNRRSHVMGRKTHPYMCMLAKMREVRRVGYNLASITTGSFSTSPHVVGTGYGPSDTYGFAHALMNPLYAAEEALPRVVVDTGRPLYALHVSELFWYEKPSSAGGNRLATCASLGNPVVDCMSCTAAPFEPSWKWDSRTYPTSGTNFPDRETTDFQTGAFSSTSTNGYKPRVGLVNLPTASYPQFVDLRALASSPSVDDQRLFANQATTLRMVDYAGTTGGASTDRFAVDYCATVDANNHIVPTPCEFRRPRVCMYDFTKYISLPGRRCDTNGISSRLTGECRVNTTVFDEYPEALEANDPYGHLLLRHFDAGTLNLLIRTYGVNYDPTREFLSNSSIFWAVPGMRKLWDIGYSTRPGHTSAGQRPDAHSGIDLNLEGNQPVSCGFRESKERGTMRRRCAARLQYCPPDAPQRVPGIIPVERLPTILRPIASGVDARYQTACGYSVRVASYVERERYGGPTPGYSDEFVVLSSSATGMQIQVQRTLVHVYNTGKSPHGYVFRSGVAADVAGEVSFAQRNVTDKN